MISVKMKFWNSLLFKTFSTKRKLKDFTPLPIVSNLLVSDIRPFGSDYQLTMNFLNRITKLAKVSNLPTETLQTCKNTNHSLYEAMIQGEFIIPEAMEILLKEEYRHIRQIRFSGKGKSISLARRAGFENLANAVYSIISCADELLPATEGFDLYKTKLLIEVELEDIKSLQNRAQKFLSDCSEAGANRDVTEPQPQINSSLISRNLISNIRSVSLLHGSLPIYEKAREFVDSVHQNQVTILSATTGSGKTTQIPKILLHHFENASVIVTQPRRVAAISLAERLAHEIDNGPVGGSVGYCVRFDAKYPSKHDSNICNRNIFR